MKIWTSQRGYAISGNPDKEYNGVETVEECKTLCLQETEFNCLSFDFGLKTSEKDCFLHKVSEATTTLSRFRKYDHYEWKDVTSKSYVIMYYWKWFEYIMLFIWVTVHYHAITPSSYLLLLSRTNLMWKLNRTFLQSSFQVNLQWKDSKGKVSVNGILNNVNHSLAFIITLDNKLNYYITNTCDDTLLWYLQELTSQMFLHILVRLPIV